MNTQLVNSLTKIILSLSHEEKQLLNQQINPEINDNVIICRKIRNNFIDVYGKLL